MSIFFSLLARGMTSVPSARFRLPDVITTSPSSIFVSFRALPVTAYWLILEYTTST